MGITSMVSGLTLVIAVASRLASLSDEKSGGVPTKVVLGGNAVASESEPTCKTCLENFYGGLVWHSFNDGIALGPGSQSPFTTDRVGEALEDTNDQDALGGPLEVVDQRQVPLLFALLEEGGGRYDCQSFNACHGNDQVNFCSQNHHACRITYYDIVQDVQEAIRTGSLARQLTVLGAAGDRVELLGSQRLIVVRACDGTRRAFSMDYRG